MRRWLCLAFCSALFFANGCGGGNSNSGPPPGVEVSVNPATANVRAGDTQRFTARVAHANNSAVTWKVNGTIGGDSTVGTIDASGLYTAPAFLPSPNNVQIMAAAVADPSAVGSSQVTLLNPKAVIAYISPSTLSPNASFTLNVVGSKFVPGAQVMLESTPLVTTFSDSSHLSAGGVAPAAGVMNLTVVNPQPDGTPSDARPIAVAVVNQRPAVRLLEQSTFGPSAAQVLAVEAGGMEKFLSDQFHAPVSVYPAPDPNSTNIFDVPPAFFRSAFNPAADSDQLRQRVMFALNQIWVVSGNKVNMPKYYTPYANLLANDAFGNYRSIMEDVTLNPAMGIYLDMVNNAKPDPVAGTHANENYARELLQLFTVGPNLLNPDGTPQLVNGGFVATYGQADIQAMARALTGWTFSDPGLNCNNFPYGDFNNPQAGSNPMVACDNNHDTDPKTILGSTLPAGRSAQADLDGALDIIFSHPNLPPFVAQRFIRNFVTSNPSPGYVTRVAGAFANGTFSSRGTTFGSGQRGDMQAMIAAMLLDPEARRGDDPATENPLDGHLREPILLMTNVFRNFNGTTDGQDLVFAISSIGQTLFNAPSVFNFYSPTFSVPLTQPPLYGPEFQLFTTASSLNRANLLEGAIFSAIASGTRMNWNAAAALANDPPTLVEALNQQLLHGTMSDAMRSEILTAVTAVDAGNSLARAQTAAYLIVSSPQYQVQR
ncbi:MAG TPA: DUF1800 domain-containing protein [Terriglobales bacterium]